MALEPITEIPEQNNFNMTISDAWIMKDEAEIEIRSIIDGLKSKLAGHLIRVVPEVNTTEDYLDIYYDFNIKLIIK